MADQKKISEFNDNSLRQIAKEIVIKRFALRIHWLAYILVNLLLFAINFFVDYTYPWHWWSIMGWGVAVATHSFNYVCFRKGLISTTTGGLIAYHIFIYLIVNAFLVFINWFTSSPQELSWVFWPIGTWGAAVIVHFIFFQMYKPKKGLGQKKSWMDRQIDDELKRVQKT